MDDPINLDDENTWPPDAIDLMTKNQHLIESYEGVQRPLSALSASRYIAQGSPKNPYREAREELIRKLEAVITHRKVIGYHATRLTEPELDFVKSSPLSALSSDLIERKLGIAIQGGFLTEEEASQLRADSRVSDSNRNNMLWFVFFCCSLHDTGIYRFLRYWGGEAMYWAHETDTIGEKLKRIGKPTILVCEVPVADLTVFAPVSQRLIASFLERRGTRCENGFSFEGYCRSPVRVRRLINWASNEFNDLTRFREWPNLPLD